MSTTTPDLAIAKDRLVDSLSTARDATRTAMREDIVPAVTATLGAAKDASGPLRAEAVARAAEAAKAVSKSEMADAVRNSELAKQARRRAEKLARRNQRSRSKRLGVAALIVGAAGAVVAIARQRLSAPGGPGTTTYPASPMAAPTEAAPASAPGEDPATSGTAGTPSR